MRDDRMGTWGTGPFDNDDAGDWVYELEEATDLGLVREPLRTALDTDDYLELAEGNNAIAAAAIVAASLDGAHEHLSEEPWDHAPGSGGERISCRVMVGRLSAGQSLAAPSGRPAVTRR